MELEGASRIRPGDTLLKLSTVAARLDISMATVWNRIKNDPLFPKPIYDENGNARLIDRELYCYTSSTYGDQPSNRANRARVKRAA